MSGDSSAPKPAAWQLSSSRRARSVDRPSSSPKVMLVGPPVCTTTPGSAMPAKMKAAPPRTCSAPTAAESFSSLSTPFCSETTAVSSPSSGASRAAADSVS